jgi:alpha-tubulin suppressor-like RCC1 family protein
MVAINVGKIKLFHRGAYSDSTVGGYKKDDVVYFEGGTYVCTRDTSSTIQDDEKLVRDDWDEPDRKIINIEYWDQISNGFRWRNEWEKDTQYYWGDVVRRNNSSYYCIKMNTEVDPQFDYEGAWDDFMKGDTIPKDKRTIMLQGESPIDWFGHPNLTGRVTAVELTLDNVQNEDEWRYLNNGWEYGGGNGTDSTVDIETSTGDATARFIYYSAGSETGKKKVFIRYEERNPITGVMETNSTLGNFNVSDIIRVKAETAWVTATAYSVGDIVTNGEFRYVCTIAGTSGGTAPTHIGNVVQSDGGCTWDYYGRSSPLGAAAVNLTAEIVSIRYRRYEANMPWNIPEHTRVPWFSYSCANTSAAYRGGIRFIDGNGDYRASGEPSSYNTDGNNNRNWNNRKYPEHMKQFYEGKNVDIRGNIRPIDKENKKFVFSHEINRIDERDKSNNGEMYTQYESSSQAYKNHSGWDQMPTRHPKIKQLCTAMYWTGLLYTDGSVGVVGHGGSYKTGVGVSSESYAGSYHLGREHFDGRRIVKITTTGTNSDSNSVTIACLDEEGEIWLWGYGGRGQMSQGREPWMISSPHNVDNSNNQATYAQGRNNDGRYPHKLAREIFFRPNVVLYDTDSPTAADQKGGTSDIGVGDPSFDLDVQGRNPGKRIIDIWGSGGSYGFWCAIDEDGEIWTWGSNDRGQLGYNSRGYTIQASTGAQALNMQMPYSTWGDNNRDQEYGGCPRRISEVIFAEMFGYKPKTNWTTFGGIQKIAMGGDADDGIRMYVLDGQGQVWVCGHGNNGAQGRNWDNHTSQQRRMYPSSLNSQGDSSTNRTSATGAVIDNTDHDDGVSSRNRMFLSHNNTWTNGYYAIISNPTGDRKESFYYGNRDNTADPSGYGSSGRLYSINRNQMNSRMYGNYPRNSPMHQYEGNMFRNSYLHDWWQEGEITNIWYCSVRGEHTFYYRAEPWNGGAVTSYGKRNYREKFSGDVDAYKGWCRTYGVGYNGRYHISNTNETDQMSLPVCVMSMYDVAVYKCSGDDGAISVYPLTDQNELYAGAWNGYGQHGNGTTNDQSGQDCRNESFGQRSPGGIHAGENTPINTITRVGARGTQCGPGMSFLIGQGNSYEPHYCHSYHRDNPEYNQSRCGIDEYTTTIHLISMVGFRDDTNGRILIGDEYIDYQDIDTGPNGQHWILRRCTRGVAGTVPQRHERGAEVRFQVRTRNNTGTGTHNNSGNGNVNWTGGFPYYGWMQINDEIIRFRYRSETRLDYVERGCFGTSAQDHPNGSNIFLIAVQNSDGSAYGGISGGDSANDSNGEWPIAQMEHFGNRGYFQTGNQRNVLWLDNTITYDPAIYYHSGWQNRGGFNTNNRMNSISFDQYNTRRHHWQCGAVVEKTVNSDGNSFVTTTQSYQGSNGNAVNGTSLTVPTVYFPARWARWEGDNYIAADTATGTPTSGNPVRTMEANHGGWRENFQIFWVAMNADNAYHLPIQDNAYWPKSGNHRLAVGRESMYINRTGYDEFYYTNDGNLDYSWTNKFIDVRRRNEGFSGSRWLYNGVMATHWRHVGNGTEQVTSQTYLHFAPNWSRMGIYRLQNAKRRYDSWEWGGTDQQYTFGWQNTEKRRYMDLYNKTNVDNDYFFRNHYMSDKQHTQRMAQRRVIHGHFGSGRDYWWSHGAPFRINDLSSNYTRWGYDIYGENWEIVRYVAHDQDAYQGSNTTQTYYVRVNVDNKFEISTDAAFTIPYLRPHIRLARNTTYRFVQADSSNVNVRFKFSYVDDGMWNDVPSLPIQGSNSGATVNYNGTPGDGNASTYTEINVDRTWPDGGMPFVESGIFYYGAPHGHTSGGHTHNEAYPEMGGELSVGSFTRRWYVRWNNNTERFEYKPYKEYLVNPTTGSGSNTVGSQSYNGDGQNTTAQRIVAMAVNSMTGDMHGDGVWNAALNDSQGEVPMQKGEIWRFDVSDPSMQGHRFAISEQPDGTWGGGEELFNMTWHVGTVGTRGAEVIYVPNHTWAPATIPANTPIKDVRDSVFGDGYLSLSDDQKARYFENRLPLVANQVYTYDMTRPAAGVTINLVQQSSVTSIDGINLGQEYWVRDEGSSQFRVTDRYSGSTISLSNMVTTGWQGWYRVPVYAFFESEYDRYFYHKVKTPHGYSKQIRDFCPVGYYDGSSSHVPKTLILMGNSQLFQLGRGYAYNGHTNNSNTYHMFPVSGQN